MRWLLHRVGGWRYILGTMVMIAFTIGGISSTLYLLRQEAISTHQNIAKLHARTFEENFAQILESIDQTIDHIPFLSNQQINPNELRKIFIATLEAAPYIRSFSLLNDQGIIQASSNPNNINHSVDLQNFLPIPFAGTSLLRIGPPWSGRDFYAAKVITNNNAIPPQKINFIPIMKKVIFNKKNYYLITTLNSDYFSNRYSASLPIKDGIVSLWRIDGTLLFSTDTTLHIGRSYFNEQHKNDYSDFWGYLKENSTHLISAQRLARTLPFIVEINMNQNVALYNWEQERNKVLWISIFLISLSGLPGLTLFLRNAKAVDRQKEQLSYEKQFRLAMEATQTGLWTWNLKTQAITFDKQCYLLLDYKPDAFVPSIELIEELTHKEDFEAARILVRDQIESHNSFIVERRMKTSTGEWRWIQTRGKIIEFSDNGEPLLLTGVNINIDAQKKAEQLRVSAVAFDSQDAITVTDAQSNILKVNQSFTNITGYTQEEVIGKKPDILHSGMQDQTFYENLWHSLLKVGFWQGEMWNKRKNGEVYAENITITAIKDTKGEISHFLSNASDITAHKVARNKVQELAYQDPLTQLSNRHLLHKNLFKVLSQTTHNIDLSALFFLDLDHFKEINDMHGHAAGDMLLMQLAKRLQECTREHDTVARIGGDEFVILLENIGVDKKRVASQAKAVAMKIITQINKPFYLADGNYSVGVSIGITLLGKTSKSTDEVIKEADTAMYKAKENGRNQVCFFEDSEHA